MNETDAQGRRTGPWEERFTNGTLSGSGNYEDGGKHGQWANWFRNGRLKATGGYANGQLLDEGTYVTGSVGSLVSGHLVIEPSASKRSSCTRRIRLTHPVLHPTSTGIR